MTSNGMMMKKIKAEIDIPRLKNMRDRGLDKAIIKFSDFTETDKTNCINVINDRIVELGGVI